MNTEILDTLLGNAIWATAVSVGYAIMFNVPKRALFGCALLGISGHSLLTILTDFNDLFIVSYFFSATLVGFLGYGLSHRMQIPMPVFTIAGIIPLMPGVNAFNMIFSLWRAFNAGVYLATPLLVKAAIEGLTVLFILAGLGVGLGLPILLLRRLEPVV